ncbi:hypothetical protein AU193_18795 [Mycobacterium sp. GA-1285]|uniref:Ltp family lipoprotein n=1 Tax=Mycobacterium sp. GA-1285 TaxID=1772282 RepID=UPI0007478E3D|nr:Ltp family lipoprotein [Mycobacterium sp. GA-1285]KUI11467.1 hypothetical protein AU193_18795 [Mycobacterium sp. GA-1285]
MGELIMLRGLLVCTTPAVAAVLLAISGVVPGAAQAASNTEIDAPAPSAASTNVIDSTPKASEPAVGLDYGPEQPLSPVSQQQAVRKANEYLAVMAFSRSGLINQLVQFEGFTPAQAAYGVTTTGL